MKLLNTDQISREILPGLGEKHSPSINGETGLEHEIPFFLRICLSVEQNLLSLPMIHFFGTYLLLGGFFCSRILAIVYQDCEGENGARFGRSCQGGGIHLNLSLEIGNRANCQTYLFGLQEKPLSYTVVLERRMTYLSFGESKEGRSHVSIIHNLLSQKLKIYI